MWRCPFSIGILLLITLLCFLSNAITDNLCNEMIAQADQALEAITQSDFLTARQATRALVDGWTKKEHLLVLFVRHNLVDEIGLQLFKLDSYLQFEERVQYAATVSALKGLLQDLLDSETPFLYHVL